MTTKFEAPNWAGESVAILANGPAMTDELAAAARAACDRVIAVNRAVRFAPWADLFVALDPEHHAGLAFDGPRVVGVELEDLEAMYGGLWYETVVLGESHTIEIRNNLLAAIRIAAAAGAAKIALYGVDTAAYEAAHNGSFVGLTEGLVALIAELRERGVEVVDNAEAAAGNAPVAIVGDSLE